MYWSVEYQDELALVETTGIEGCPSGAYPPSNEEEAWRLRIAAMGPGILSTMRTLAGLAGRDRSMRAVVREARIGIDASDGLV